MTTNYLRLYKGLKIFRDAMVPFIEEKLQAVYGNDWWEKGVARCFRSEDIKRMQDQFEKRHNSLVVNRPGDRLAQMLDINHFGNIIEANWKQVFGDTFGDRMVISWLDEVREARNAGAHPQAGDLQPDDVWRALDTAERILSRVNSQVAGEIRRLKHELYAPPEPQAPPMYLETDWMCYCDSLASELELESSRYGVPVDILENRVREYDKTHLPGSQSGRGESWLDVSSRQGRGLTVLLGNPGEGKTVSFALLARRLLDDFRSNPNAPLPVRVRLTFFEQRERSLKELIAEQLRSGGLEISDAMDVPGVLAQRRFAVLLDGLNEVLDHVPLVGELGNLMSKAPDNLYFLSCRQADYGRVQEQLPPHIAWQLQRFEPVDIEKFLGQYLKTDPERQNKLKVWLEDDRLLEVLGTPFFLSLFSNLDLKELPFPRNRAELCQIFVDSFYARELKAHAEQRPIGDPWPILESAAFHMQESRTTHLSTAQFEDQGRRIWTEQLIGQQTSVSLHETLQALYRSPLLDFRPGMVAFAHQLFRDFFAARALKKGIKGINVSDPSSLQQFVTDTWWDHTIVLLTGLLPDATPVLYDIVYEGTNYGLAVRCLYESRRLELRVVQDVVEWLRKSHRFVELWQLGPLVARLPEDAKEWRIAEADAIVRTMLTHETGYTVWALPMVDAVHRWPISEEMTGRAALDAVQSANETERGNSLPILAFQGHWDTVLQYVSDPSSHVREMVAYAISKIEGGDHATLMQATRQLAQDREVEVRWQAMEAAGRLVSNGGLEILQEALNDPDTNVWQAALDELVKCTSGQADKVLTQVVPILTQRLDELQHESGEKVEERIDKLLSALARTDTEESSDALFAAMLSDMASPAFVANVLVGRGDPRAVRAVLVDLTFEMLEFPDEYLKTPWRDFIFTGKELPEGRKEFVEAELNSLFGRPFELGWLESLFIPGEATAAWLERDLALEELSKLCRSNRAALSLLLWTCLIAWGKLVEWTEPTDSLLDAAIWHLIEIDPGVLVELIPDTAQRSLLWAAGEFAFRLLQCASVLTGALSHDKRQELLDLYTD